jgi:EmrB/QacA subfamily drug resistance transporter
MKLSKKWSALWVVLLGTFTLILNNSMVNVAIPQFMQIFHISSFTAQWFMTIFMIGMGVATPLSGYMGDRLGKRNTYMITMVLFICASLLASISWNEYAMMLFRALQGFAGGLMMPLSMAILFQAVPREERGMALGYWGVASMMAPAFGPVIGGWIMEYSRWELLFLVNIPVGMLCILAAYFLLDREEGSKGISFDQKGFILATLGILILLLGMNGLNIPGGWSEPVYYILMLVGVALLWVFIQHEGRVEQPLLNFGVFEQRTYRYSVMIASMQSINLFAGILLVPILLQTYFGYTALQTGLVILPMALFSGIGMTFGGRLLDRMGPSYIVPIGLIMLVATNAMMFTVGESTPLWILLVILGVRGFGTGFVGIPATTMGMNTVSPSLVSRASAINNVVRQIFAALGVVFIVLYYEFRLTLMAGHDPTLMKEAGVRGIQEAFVLLALIALICLPIAFKMKGAYSKHLKLMETKHRGTPSTHSI